MPNIKKGLSFLALLGVLVIPQRVNQYEKNLAPQVKGLSTSSQQEILPISSAPELATAEQPPALLAKSAISVDRDSGTILYSQAMDEKLPVASLTKLMTAIVVMDKLALDQVVSVKAPDIAVVGSNMGLVPGERITVVNLLRGMLIPSSNDAAKVLAAAAGGNEENFVRMMNEKAASLELSSTHFSNPVGLDDPENYSTCRDLLKVVDEFVRDETRNAIVRTKNSRVSSIDGKITHELRSSNKLLLENSKIIGVKTGYTSLAKGNLITRMQDGGRDIVTVVLNSDEREEDTRKLNNWVTEAYRW